MLYLSQDKGRENKTMRNSKKMAIEYLRQLGEVEVATGVTLPSSEYEFDSVERALTKSRYYTFVSKKPVTYTIERLSGEIAEYTQYHAIKVRISDHESYSSPRFGTDITIDGRLCTIHEDGFGDTAVRARLDVM